MRNRKIFPQVIFVVLAAGFILLNSSTPKQNKTVPSAINISRQTAMVEKVVDGDTIKVLLNNQEDTVRLIGIDSPEIVDERKPIQCFGKEASNKAKEILNGKTIMLESDSTQGERDEYGRLLRYVFLNGLNFDKFMIGEGFAREYTFKNKIYKYQTEFIQAEQQAKENKKGLWGAC